MTVESSTAKAGPYDGNGVATAFPFDFRVFNTDEVVVVQLEIASGIETILALDSDYSITLSPDQNLNPGGTITYPLVGAPLSALFRLTATSALEYSQQTDIPEGGAFFASVVEAALDRATILVQQVLALQNASLRYPVSDPALGVELPPAAQRAGMYLTFDASGNVLVGQSAASAVISAAMIPVVQAVTLILGRAALGVGGLAENNTWTGAQKFLDNKFTIADNGDATKQVAFEVSGVATGTTRTVTLPNKSGTLAMLSDIPTVVLPKGYRDPTGFKLTYNSATSMDHAAGTARDSTNAADIVLAAAITNGVLQAAGSWTAGNGGNKLDTGVRGNSSIYYRFVVSGASGSDILYSLNRTAPTLTAAAALGYGANFRRLPGALITDGSGNIRAQDQYGVNKFKLRDGILDANNMVVNSTAALFTLSTPPLMEAVCNTEFGAASSVIGCIQDTAQTSVPVSGSAVPLGNMIATSTITTYSEKTIRVDASRQARVVGSATSALYISTMGYTDDLND